MSRIASLPALIRLCLCAAVLAANAGCALGYYAQAAQGQMALSTGSEPVTKLLDDAELEPALRARLLLSRAALDFAHTELRLPDNGSYRRYTDTGRENVVWNVFAAPELSLEPRTWCFPIAGCVAYRGYFSAGRARAYADKLAADGYDVFVAGVAAYSTLGRLRDPLLNTMLPLTDDAFVALLFHELAHQRVYVQDDSAFNEGFATAVEREGLRRWQALEGRTSKPVPSPAPAQNIRALLLDYRQRLAVLYASDLPAAEMRRRKSALLAALEEEYATRGRAGRLPYASLFASGINNAALAALATYDDEVPAFEAMLAACAGELECFYVAAEGLAALEPEQRAAELAVWATFAPVAGTGGHAAATFPRIPVSE